MGYLITPNDKDESLWRTLPSCTDAVIKAMKDFNLIDNSVPDKIISFSPEHLEVLYEALKNRVGLLSKIFGREMDEEVREIFFSCYNTVGHLDEFSSHESYSIVETRSLY